MRLALCFMAIVASAAADTITLTDGSFVNAMVKYDKVHRRFTLQGRVQGTPQKFQDIPVELVKTIRFNSLDNNGEAPPASPTPRGDSVVEIEWELTLEQGNSEHGPPETITEDQVLLAANKSYPKDQIKVLRVVRKPPR
jgi:hypothetical protein